MKKLLLLILSILACTTGYGSTPKTLGIFTYKVLGCQPWDADSIKSGITGSEEAVIYIAEKLANLGYQVIVFADPPAGSPHSLQDANPRYVSTEFNDGTTLDIAIAWRSPDAAQRLKERAKKVYLWPHDTFSHPLTEAQISGFDDVLWLTNWQREYWMSINPGFSKFTRIFGNGINPEQFGPIQERSNPYSCIYSSNYARGLDVLLDIWPKIKQQYPRATLDIYYGWQHWGLLSPEKEIKMRVQLATLASLDVRDHGLVSHAELNKAHEQTSLWTYPCTGWEVFCIAGIRAQYTGTMPVIIEGSALPETAPLGYKCAKREEYFETLSKVMDHAEKITLDDRKKLREFVHHKYTWEIIAKKWKELFENKSD
jgi:glycosyltransferase involved in cell wall biosynthesis